MNGAPAMMNRNEGKNVKKVAIQAPAAATIAGLAAAFQRTHRGAVTRHRQRQARESGPIVDQHRACSAGALAACHLERGERFVGLDGPRAPDIVQQVGTSTEEVKEISLRISDAEKKWEALSPQPRMSAVARVPLEACRRARRR